ncbi:MAG TPA: hypothetical protein VHZ99_14005 [Steroidobacteraceae bacterium]|jgi:hypothetical protein|nr:hypothetical protein [Steroidobacteraceae bacterium]
MDATTNEGMILAIVLIVIAVAAIAAVYLYRRRQSQRLKVRFGTEYRRTVKQLGGETKAEAELRRREARMAKLNIRPLTVTEAERFGDAWTRVQGRFVDNPRGAVADADKLVTELMTARGYPMSDFDRRAADISVDHPRVVDSYRSAQLIAVKDSRGEADTEELRRAIVHYRTLFADLLQVHTPSNAAEPGHVAVQP